MNKKDRDELKKPFQDGDAIAVESTAYALLTIFLTEGGGITFTQVKQDKTNGHFPKYLI